MEGDYYQPWELDGTLHPSQCEDSAEASCSGSGGEDEVLEDGEQPNPTYVRAKSSSLARASPEEGSSPEPVSTRKGLYGAMGLHAVGPERVASKKPRSILHCDEEFAEEPDLFEYFSSFDDFDELAQVKLCRAYANMLSAKSAKNRLRYSDKKKARSY